MMLWALDNRTSHKLFHLASSQIYKGNEIIIVLAWKLWSVLSRVEYVLTQIIIKMY